MAVVEVITGGKKVENVIVGVPQPMSPPGALPPDIGYVEISTSDDRGSIWDTGEGPPTTPASQPGDMYLDVDTGDIYRWNGTEWVLEGNFAPGTDTPEEILAKIITVDGEGSLLDADTLDGHDSTYFATDADMDAANIAITGLDGRLDNVEGVNDMQDDRLDTVETDLTLKANIDSPTLTGDPRAPTPTAGDNDTSIATTAYVTTAIATQKATDTTDYVNVTGDTMTGNLVITPTATSPVLTLNKPVGTFNNVIRGEIAGSLRWLMWHGNSVAETGANAGSNFTLYRYADNGTTNLGATIAINRTDGVVQMPSGATLVGGKAALSEAPVDGLTYGRKDAAWATIVGGAIVSDTPPVGPAPGQMWYEADSGNTYIWYSDADSSQWVQQNIAAPISGMPSGLTAETRNRVINPAMQISQENGDTGGTTNSYYPADQWVLTTSVATTAALRTRPSGSGSDCLQTSVSTPKPALAAGDYWFLAQPIEGTRVRDFRWGSASAKQAVLRFSVYGTIGGTFTVSIKNSANDRTFLAPFTLSAGAWTDFTIVIPGDTTGTWLTTTGIGITVQFNFATGTTYGGGVAGWQAGNKHGITGMTNGAASVSSFYLADVGLYLDPLNSGIPPRWQMPDEAEELRACQRYYWKGLPAVSFNYPAYATSSAMSWPVSFGTTMRSVPAMTIDTTSIALTATGAPTVAASTVSGARLLTISTGPNNNAAFTFTASNYIAANARM